MTEKPEVQAVYAPHGYFDTDVQDMLFDEVFPEFFRGGAMNVLVREDAGSYLDTQRDEMFDAAKKKPAIVPARAPIKAPYFIQVEARLRSALGTVSANSLMGRQALLLGKWNAEHRGTVVLPWMESFPDTETRDAISREADTFTVIRALRHGASWRAVVAAFRESDGRFLDYINRRDDNIVRVLENLLDRMDGTRERVKILLNFGSLHAGLTDKIRAGVSDRIQLLDDIVLSDADTMPLSQVDDKEYLRGLYFKFVVVGFMRGHKNELGRAYVFNRNLRASLLEYVRSLSLAQIVADLHLSMEDDESEKDVFVDVAAQDAFASKFLDGNHVGGDVVVDRGCEPNNVYIDKLYVLSSLCMIFGIGEPDDARALLLKQLIDRLVQHNPDNLGKLRAEILGWTIETANADQAGTERPVWPMLMSKVMVVIADQNPLTTDLWDAAKYRGERKNPSIRLVQQAREMLRLAPWNPITV